MHGCVRTRVCECCWQNFPLQSYFRYRSADLEDERRGSMFACTGAKLVDWIGGTGQAESETSKQNLQFKGKTSTEKVRLKFLMEEAPGQKSYMYICKINATYNSMYMFCVQGWVPLCLHKVVVSVCKGMHVCE